MESNEAVGQRIAKAREFLGLTQAVVAEKLGLARTTQVAIEQGRRPVSVAELYKYSEVLSRPLDYFLGLGVWGKADFRPHFRLMAEKLDASAVGSATPPGPAEGRPRGLAREAPPDELRVALPQLPRAGGDQRAAAHGHAGAARAAPVLGAGGRAARRHRARSPRHRARRSHPRPSRPPRGHVRHPRVRAAPTRPAQRGRVPPSRHRRVGAARRALDPAHALHPRPRPGPPPRQPRGGDGGPAGRQEEGAHRDLLRRVRGRPAHARPRPARALRRRAQRGQRGQRHRDPLPGADLRGDPQGPARAPGSAQAGVDGHPQAHRRGDPPGGGGRPSRRRARRSRSFPISRAGRCSPSATCSWPCAPTARS